MELNGFLKILALSVLLGAVPLCQPALAEDTGTISATVRESGTDGLLPCRAWVTVKGKRLFSPEPGNGIVYVKDRSFSGDGQFVIEVPAGRAVVHVERGKEYRPVDQAVTVESDQRTEIKIQLKRWVHMAEEGWFSGDG